MLEPPLRVREAGIDLPLSDGLTSPRPDIFCSLAGLLAGRSLLARARLSPGVLRGRRRDAPAQRARGAAGAGRKQARELEGGG